MDALYADVKRSVALEETIREEITNGGPMPFARFMERALYHPTLGYYRAKPAATTRGGDFLTGPETHPLFGALMARFSHAAMAALGVSEWTVVEQGAGTGALAASFRNHWKTATPGDTLHYVIVEPDGAARDRLRGRLGDSVSLVASLKEVTPFTGLYLSNELPDAFPVHRVRRRNGGLVEVSVGLERGHLAEVETPPTTGALAAYLEESGIALVEGQEIEVSLGLRPWLRDVAGTLERGFMLTVDYGYEGSEAVRFPRGTLLAHYRHGANEDFLERIGMQDLTAHVCWTAMERLGAEAGFHTLERTTQRAFLSRWGWKEEARRLMAQGNAGWEELDAVDRLGRLEDGLGGLGVLLQGKGGVPLPNAKVASGEGGR